MEKKILIIIPFLSLNQYVVECIEHCLRLNYSNFELILISDNEISFSEQFNDKRIKVIVSGDATIAQKRNIGINSSPADFYAFIDSDAYPIKDWLKNAVSRFISDEIWAVGGPNLTPPNDGACKKAVGNSLKSFLVSGPGAFRKKIVENRFCNDLPTCNLVVKKECIELLKGFNDNLITGEDKEFCRRIMEESKKIHYNNKVVVYHHNRSLFKSFFNQRLTYGLSVLNLIKEKFFLSSLLLLAPLFFILFLVLGLIAGVFYKTIFLVWLIVVLFYILILLIETFRYSECIKEAPLTFIALLIGNLSPGIGTLFAILKIDVNVKKIYKNFDLVE